MFFCSDTFAKDRMLLKGRSSAPAMFTESFCKSEILLGAITSPITWAEQRVSLNHHSEPSYLTDCGRAGRLLCIYL